MYLRIPYSPPFVLPTGLSILPSILFAFIVIIPAPHNTSKELTTSCVPLGWVHILAVASFLVLRLGTREATAYRPTDRRVLLQTCIHDQSGSGGSKLKSPHMLFGGRSVVEFSLTSCEVGFEFSALTVSHSTTKNAPSPNA
ncbi:hypothetical protein AcW1_008800 [Taiwanofungus camphoratus]|nr:hypothetical protein AcV7_003715 [Antrodia cinnamomea]KAI0949099.1 hypothetical protein AcW1_008800 [Antrodia cinnamomea]